MMQMKKTIAGVVATGVLALPGAAYASGGSHPSTSVPTGNVSTHAPTTVSSFDKQKARCLRLIGERVERLDKLATAIGQSADPHDAALLAIINSAKTDLASLQSDINAITSDADALKAKCMAIYQLRIYALRIPQINLVMSVDKFDGSLTKLDGLIPQLEAAIAAAKTAGNPNADAAETMLGKLKDSLADAKTKLGSIDIDAVLALTPADWDANHKVLKPYLSSLRDARLDLKKASQKARMIAHLLDPSEPAPTSTATA